MSVKFFKLCGIPLLLLALILCSLGCAISSDKDEKVFEDEMDSVYRDLKPVKLSMFFPGRQPSDWDVFKPELEKKLKDNVKASLDFNWVSEDTYLDSVMTAMESGVCDAFECGWSGRLSEYAQLAREGKLKDITELFPKYAPRTYSKLEEEERSLASVDGRLYSVPSLYPQGIRTYVEIAGNYPEAIRSNEMRTYEDYEAAMKKLLDSMDSGVPGWIAGRTSIMSLFAQLYGYVILDDEQNLLYKWDDPDMKVVAWENTKEFKEAINRLNSWIDSGYISPRAQAASWLYATSEDLETLSLNSPNQIFLLYPEKTVQRCSSVEYNSFLFNPRSENTERVLLFLDWIQSGRDNYNTMVYGIENKHFILKDGYPSYINMENYPDDGYLTWSRFAFLNPQYEKMKQSEKENGSLNHGESIKKILKFPPHAGFQPDYGKVSEIADKRKLVIRSFDEQVKARQQSAPDPDAYIKKLTELGTYNLIKEVQGQLNEWRNSRH